MSANILWLYDDLLDLYGDSGNLLILCNRLKKMGLEPKVSRLSLGDTLEALCPDGRSIPLTPEWIENEAGERVDSTPHAMEKYTMPTPELPPMSLLRRKTV